MVSLVRIAEGLLERLAFAMLRQREMRDSHQRLQSYLKKVERVLGWFGNSCLGADFRAPNSLYLSGNF